jgi:hypothetical protein
MKRLCFFVVLALTLPVTFSQSVDKPGYKTGKVRDLRRDNTGSGAARAQASFCLTIELGDMSYLVRYEPYWRWTYEPIDLVVGDRVEARIKGNDMYLKTPKGNMKTRIARRERNAPDKRPMTCG